MRFRRVILLPKAWYRTSELRTRGKHQRVTRTRQKASQKQIFFQTLKLCHTRKTQLVLARKSSWQRIG
jgi:hypothetical protein